MEGDADRIETLVAGIYEQRRCLLDFNAELLAQRPFASFIRHGQAHIYTGPRRISGHFVDFGIGVKSEIGYSIPHRLFQKSKCL